MPDQTLIAIPPDVTNKAQLRQFLVALIVELDKIRGFRGSTESIASLDERIKKLEEAQ